MSGDLAVRLACVMVTTAAAAACNSNRVSVSGFPGLGIAATCRAGSTTASYSVSDGMYPGERAAGDLLDNRFFGGIGELPLPCIDRRAETYRVYQYNGGEFGGFVLVGISRTTAGSRIWVVWKPYGGSHMQIRRGERALLDLEWDRIANKISAINFWSQPARLLPEPYRAWGAQWKVEGYANRRYHSVSRFYDDKVLKDVVGAILELARPPMSASAQ